MDLEFKRVLDLVNKTGSIDIAVDPVEVSGGRWAIYEGHLQGGGVPLPIDILYLHPGLDSRDEFARALTSLTSRGAGSVKRIVYADNLVEDGRFPGVAKDTDGNPRIGLRAFFSSFAQQALNGYKAFVKQQYNLAHYISPDIRKENPVAGSGEELYDRIFGRGARRRGSLNVLLAEPGQGKTYLSMNIAQHAAAGGRIPVFVTSSQWQELTSADLASLWKTVLNSFQQQGYPIAWAAGAEEEFVRVAQKCGLVTLIFDGFDEYVLRTGSETSAADTIKRFEELAFDTESPILVTSRTAFWESEVQDVFVHLDRNIDRSVYSIQPFGHVHAKKYFENRFESAPRAAQSVAEALRVFDQLKKRGADARHDLVGRGLFLPLIADLVQIPEDGELVKGDSPIRNPISWISTQLCQREIRRQELELDVDEQYGFMEELAETIAVDANPTTQTVAVLLQGVVSKLDGQKVESLTGKLGGRGGKLGRHPLLHRSVSDDRWGFAQEQLYYFFLASRVLALLARDDGGGPDYLRHFLGRLEGKKQLQFEIATQLVEVIGTDEDCEESLRGIVKRLAELELTSYQGRDTRGRSSIATSVAMQVINKRGSRISNKLERTALLTNLLGSKQIENLFFADALSNFDFRGITFANCRFENLTFLRCDFDQTTRFIHCTFEGVTVFSRTLAYARFEECTMDEAFGRFRRGQQGIGEQNYSYHDLLADFDALLDRLMPAGVVTPRPLPEQVIFSAHLNMSPFRQEIVSVAKQYLVDLSADDGTKTYQVRASVIPAIQFFRANNLHSGPIREAWTVLARACNFLSKEATS